MTQQRLKSLRLLAMSAAIVLLPVTGYVWSLPPSGFMLLASGILSVASVLALLFVNHFAVEADKEIARLSGELESKSAQVLELVEAEREDDRIIESLSEKVSQLKSTLLSVQTKHVSERQRILVPDLIHQEAAGKVVPLSASRAHENPRIYSPQEFRLLATQCARIAARYDRYFTVIRLRMNVEDRRREVGATQANNEFRVAVDVIARTLRTSDFASTEDADSIVIGYPETSSVHVDAILSRLRSALGTSTARDLHIEVDPSSGGAIRI